MSENLRQILDDHELYKSVQRMSSYAAQTSPRPISPRSYVGSNTGLALAAENIENLARSRMLSNSPLPPISSHASEHPSSKYSVSASR